MHVKLANEGKIIFLFCFTYMSLMKQTSGEKGSSSQPKSCGLFFSL